MRLVALLLLVAAGLSPVASAIPAESGLPVPRFVSLHSSKVNVRTGPGVRYPVEWVLLRRGLPVEVVAEFENWRKIRDSQGTEGWVHQSMLSGTRGVVIMNEVRSLRRKPAEGTGVVARAEPGVVARLLECRGEWCRIEANGFKGWVRRHEVWGVYDNEKVD
jgi:SH3-like domain-containing protein